MRRKLLAMDIDGTAVRDDSSLGEKSKEAIKLAQQEGHKIVFVSGRRDSLIASLLFSPKLEKKAKIPPHVCKRLITHCLEQNIQLQIYNGMTWQVTKMTDETLEYAKNVGVIPEIINSLEETDWKYGLEGFMATQDMTDVAAYIDECIPEVYYVSSEPNCIDVMAKGVSKWNGIQLLADMLEICKEDIITVGNYYNDLDMLQHAAVGIAVANAVDDVKKEADFVTEKNNNQDAVAEIITKMLNHDYDVVVEKCNE